MKHALSREISSANCFTESIPSMLPFFDAIIAAMKSINILVVIALEIHDYMNTHARLNCLNHCYYYRYFADTPYEHMSE